MNIERLPYLLTRYHEGTLNVSEWEELKYLMDQEDLVKSIAEDLDKTYPLPVPLNWDRASIQKAWHKIDQAKKNSGSPVRRIHFFRRGFFRYAAAVVLVLGSATAAYLWTTNKKSKSPGTDNLTVKSSDVPPGGDKAVLTLADGSKIILDSAANGKLANQGSVQVMKLANGQVDYDVRGLATKEVMMNTMSTPKGGQYRLMLPDGSKVWLNAASSIQFPAAFVGTTRSVKVTGEVYFEIAPNSRQPFKVKVDDMTVDVLGTSFNVNAYDDENALKTTLISGSVRVLSGVRESSRLQPNSSGTNGNNVILKPGQQAEIAEGNSGIIKVESANVDQALAWKNGFFDLEGLDIRAVMRQLERWYDIEVQYESSMHNGVFHGKIFRNTNLSDVIELMQKMGVECRLKGKTLIIL